MDSNLLAGDTALVTGAGQGIGRAIVQALAREGARVFLTDLAGGSGEAVAQAIAPVRESGFLAADLNEPDSADKVFDAAIAQFGSVSIFVHCACPRVPSAPILEMHDKSWDEMFAVNVQSGYRLARRVGKQMCDRKIKGRMLFITSLHAETPRTNPHYSSAKAGVTMLMKELAKALGPYGIRVNAIAPGLVAANWYADAEPIVRKTPLQRLGSPDEIGGVAVALLADRFSSFVTGTVVTADGGLTLYNWLDP